MRFMAGMISTAISGARRAWAAAPEWRLLRRTRRCSMAEGLAQGRASIYPRPHGSVPSSHRETRHVELVRGLHPSHRIVAVVGDRQPRPAADLVPVSNLVWITSSGSRTSAWVFRKSAPARGSSGRSWSRVVVSFRLKHPSLCGEIAPGRCPSAPGTESDYAGHGRTRQCHWPQGSQLRRQGAWTAEIHPAGGHGNRIHDCRPDCSGQNEGPGKAGPSSPSSESGLIG